MTQVLDKIRRLDEALARGSISKARYAQMRRELTERVEEAEVAEVAGAAAASGGFSGRAYVAEGARLKPGPSAAAPKARPEAKPVPDPEPLPELVPDPEPETAAGPDTEAEDAVEPEPARSDSAHMVKGAALILLGLVVLTGLVAWATQDVMLALTLSVVLLAGIVIHAARDLIAEDRAEAEAMAPKTAPEEPEPEGPALDAYDAQGRAVPAE